jgi:hydrogenase maturation protease
MTIIIGIGNVSRRDDGAGPSFVRECRSRLRDAPGVKLFESDGDPAELLGLWAGVPLVIVVDAASSGRPPGTVTEVDLTSGSNGVGLRHSTHAMGLTEAVQLGRALGRMPAELRVFAIEGEDFSHGEGLSPLVARAVTELVQVVEEIVGCGELQSKRQA